ncbi:hypothetical protein D3C76_728830 [compost metagenome]
MAEDLVEDVGLLQVVQLFRGADEGGDREAFAGQQFEERLEGDQRRHTGNLPAGSGPQDFVDLAQLRNAVMGQLELIDAVQVFLARTAFDDLQLTGDQRVPHRMLLLRVVDKTMRIGLACHVLRLFHVALLVRAFLVMSTTCLRNIPSWADLHGGGLCG